MPPDKPYNPDSVALVATTRELHDMYRRIGEIRDPIPNSDLQRAVDKLLSVFPAVFMQLRDEIGCAVLREYQMGEDDAA